VLYEDGSSIAAARVVNPLRGELQRAVERQELVLHYQPIVDLHDGSVSSFEALMRWKHPTRGMIAPSEFIGIAEETRLIVRMGSWGLMQACMDAKSWPETVKVSVNLSAVQIEAGDVCDVVAHVLDATGLDPQRLQLEISETDLRRVPRIWEVLTKLQNLGVGLTLEDFGTSFASLRYLRTPTLRATSVFALEPRAWKPQQASPPSGPSDTTRRKASTSVFPCRHPRSLARSRSASRDSLARRLPRPVISRPPNARRAVFPCLRPGAGCAP
jgi:hypothetical protein